MKMRISISSINGYLLLLIMVIVLLSLGSIKREVHFYFERLQNANQNGLLPAQRMQKKMTKVEADVNRLRESHRCGCLMLLDFTHLFCFVFYLWLTSGQKKLAKGIGFR